jgi:hypothetical protein
VCGEKMAVEDDVQLVRASFLYSPKKLKGTAAKELSMSKTTVWRVMRKRLVFSCYKCNHGEHYETPCIIVTVIQQNSVIKLTLRDNTVKT